MEIKDCKIMIGSKAESVMVQKAAFEYGIGWFGQSESEKNLVEEDGIKAVFIIDGKMSISSKGYVFDSLQLNPISVHDFLLLQPIEWTAEDIAEWMFDCYLAQGKIFHTGTCFTMSHSRNHKKSEPAKFFTKK